MPALAVLVVACPCASSWPPPPPCSPPPPGSPVAACSSRAARPWNGWRRVDALAFDKTGTLTEGRPELADRIAIGDLDPRELLRLAAAAEQPSEHPLARLLVSEARRAGLALPAVAEFQAQPGAGIAADVLIDGQRRSVLVGNLRLFSEAGVSVPPEIEEALTAPRRIRPDRPPRRRRRPARRRARRPRPRPTPKPTTSSTTSNTWASRTSRS